MLMMSLWIIMLYTNKKWKIGQPSDKPSEFERIAVARLLVYRYCCYYGNQGRYVRPRRPWEFHHWWKDLPLSVFEIFFSQFFSGFFYPLLRCVLLMTIFFVVVCFVCIKPMLRIQCLNIIIKYSRFLCVYRFRRSN